MTLIVGETPFCLFVTCMSYLRIGLEGLRAKYNIIQDVKITLSRERLKRVEHTQLWSLWTCSSSGLADENTDNEVMTLLCSIFVHDDEIAKQICLDV